MMVARKLNNITFSFNQDYLEKLEQLAEEGESLGLCAKRLLISLLDNGNFPNDIHLESRLEALEQTLDHLSNAGNSTGNINLQPLEQRLETLEQTLEHLSTTWSGQIAALAGDSP